jgi:porin
VHVQLLRTDGNSLSAKVGDIQTADSIDTRPVTRLFESWIEQKIGGDDRSLAFRFGLMDLNADFDSIQTASLFTNSSQGIGADLARSGRNGPSIYPVSAAGLRISWLPNKTWTFRVAAFDGVPGDPSHPRAFASARLALGDGALVIAQVDYHLSDKAKIEAGAWRYSARLPDSAGMPRPDEGTYVSIEGPVPGTNGLSAWGRIGVANGHAQLVSGYFGTGLVWQGLLDTRPEDRVGLAIARAMIGDDARRALGLHSAETSIELSYQLKIHETFALQPDMQYIVHPASVASVHNALVMGLRIVVTAGYPKKAPANEATDPTVPPDGPQPPDDQAPPPAPRTY